MPRIHFGHCIGCDQPIRPPYLSFAVNQVRPEGAFAVVQHWEAVDVCNPCAGRLTVEALFKLVSEEEAEEPAT